MISYNYYIQDDPDCMNSVLGVLGKSVINSGDKSEKFSYTKTTTFSSRK